MNEELGQKIIDTINTFIGEEDYCVVKATLSQSFIGDNYGEYGVIVDFDNFGKPLNFCVSFSTLELGKKYLRFIKEFLNVSENTLDSTPFIGLNDV